MRRARAAGLPALAVLLIVAVARAQVQQEPFLETTEGTGINITCSHPKIQSSELIYWYRQLPGRGPELLMSIHKDSKKMPDNAGQLSVSADRRSSWLWLAEPRRGDAAVYYCALGKSRKERSGWKVTFGSGTQLVVKPEVTPSPSVYRLTSKDAQGLEMCLITDYSPEKLTVSSAEQHTSAVVGVATDGDSEESSYLSTYWATSDHLHCAASHEGFGELEGEDPESGASAVCVTGLSLHFRTDEHLNTISLSQLGLKIILMKGIIFNVLMTVLVWKKKKD
ncbi:T cell receptor alpha chain MC.7.G5-like [Ammospiza nelsoni]|uniref:T cell receptor alpha chain MC.7.G5-like n=1 Tax=Ammospiza nelsoni TaxID=2857394 RepID=UPI00286CF93C|nr:T cell receptor alpha chain MC.7.G5-like [Ammospiza nelsoni]